jgi:hypothetical protein
MTPIIGFLVSSDYPAAAQEDNAATIGADTLGGRFCGCLDLFSLSVQSYFHQ